MPKTLKDKILAKVDEEIKVIETNALNEANSVYEKMIRDAKLDFEKRLKKAQEKTDNQINRAKLDYERSLRDEVALVKQDLIGSIFNEVRTYLLNLNGKPLFEFILHSIKAVNIKGDETIKVNKNEYGKYAEVLTTQKGKLVDCDLLNNKLGKDFNLKLSSDSADIDSGFLVIGKVYDLNFSIQETINKLANQYEKEIYEELK